MTLSSGTRLGQYEVVDAIGAGGMGEVYRARDTKLGRDVAIKVLPEELAKDSERLARFEREAKLLASLNHPAIATLHGFEDGFLVMELVEGETLAERIARGPLPLEEVRSLFVQIANGLEAAHDKGVIHRDLKPANIKMTPNDHVKILDFGLARLAEPDGDPSSAGSSQSPTLTKGTALGAIMGTASYMSPEQARGKTVDKRTDIWAFGACLYEALTAKKAFPGETVTDVLAGVINKEPEWETLPESTPWEIRKLVRRCLAKEPRRRVHDIADARNELEETSAELSPPVSQSTGRRPLVFAAALASALAGFLLAHLGERDDTVARPTSRLTIEVPDQGLSESMVPPFAISHDGRRIAMVVQPPGGPPQIYLRSLGQFEATPLPGTENAKLPFFSRNGEWIGFWADNRLRKVSISGGTIDVAELPGVFRGASWGVDDTIIFGGGNTGLRRVSASSGEPAIFTTTNVERGETYHAWPDVLPNGTDVLFTIQRGRSEIAIASLETGEWRPLEGTEGAVQARYLASAHLVYARADGLFVQPFDARARVLTGSPTLVASSVNQRSNAGLQLVDFDVSRNGTLVYASAADSPDPLMLVDHAGRAESLGVEMQRTLPRRPQVSPSGMHIALSYNPEPGVPDIWIRDLARDSLTRLTTTGRNTDPVWSPDGSRIAFASFRGDSFDIYSTLADGSSDAAPLLSRALGQYPRSWFPDGSALAFNEFHPRTGMDIWVLHLDPERQPTPVLISRFHEEAPAFSPDGRYLAYQSDESGRDEVYVQPYPGPGSKLMVSTEGGEEPVWSPDGTELYFRSVDAMMVASIDTDGTLTSGRPRALFDWRFVPNDTNLYDISPDGEHFVMVRDDREPLIELNVVLDWTEELPRP